jgi:hypothetical protein
MGAGGVLERLLLESLQPAARVRREAKTRGAAARWDFLPSRAFRDCIEVIAETTGC